MKSITPILCILAILMVGCQGSEHSQTSDLKLQLNDGNKWEANPETQDGFIEMKNRLTSFASLENPTLLDFKELGKNLQVIVDRVIQKCTMKGKGHEELHKLLIPVMNNITDLKEGDVTVCKEAVNELDKLTQRYFDYFQVSGM